ncbi:hypothetical protein NEMIN01_1008 [Nematocida minor]|uniref:uncharacterized protein n=1 Tax=Nematocida minor TaxID=1912983 RepID=UPI0022207F05|nr:uncharacterized protein NEMIN01_1008 [Nematocida minor]KAI5190384.1 hypothetical protein NEMIN01_1008 [Nematocida minor]
MKKILNAVSIALVFFIAKCRGSWNTFSGSLYSSADPSIEGNSAVNRIIHQLTHPEQYILANTMHGSISNPTHGMPRTPKQEDGTNTQDFSLFNQYQCSLSQNKQKSCAEQLKIEEESRQQQHIAPPTADMSVFNVPRATVIISRNGSQMVGEKSPFLGYFGTDASSSRICNPPKSTEAWKDMYLPSSQIAGGPSTSGVSTSGEKRKAEKMDISTEASAFQPAAKSKKKETAPQCEPCSSTNAAKERKRIKNLNVKTWNMARLTNKRRENYKLYHQTVYNCKHGNFYNYMWYEIKKDAYEKTMREDIENFSDLIAPAIEQNTLWYFIASRTINVVTRHRDLLWLDKLISDKDAGRLRKSIESFKGYYPGVVEEMLAYMEKHKPLRVIKSYPTTTWNETLGDIYLPKSLDLKYEMVKNQGKISQVENKYSALAYALRMILALSEVHQDFSQITITLIKNSKILKSASKNERAQQVLLSIHTIIKKFAENHEKIENEYKNIYAALETIYERKAQKKPTVSELYKEIYILLAEFYEKVKVFDINSHVFAGKCAIKHQKYVRCEATLVSASKKSCERVSDPKYTLDLKKWGISPDVKSHYHVYYVNNTTHQSRKLCMPIYKRDESSEEQYIHTIDGILSYIKEIYEIEENPWAIHPFKVDIKTRKWSYIKDEERNLTAKDLKGYQVVFYRIDEDIATAKFTFAEFRPLIQHSGNSISIPLFLTPLMRSAIDLGPFTEKAKHKEINLTIDFEDVEPSVYNFNNIYIYEEYSNIHTYYSNLCILPEEEKEESLDCYIMDYQVVEEDNTKKAVWYVNMTQGANAYTHCLLDKRFKEKENSRKLNSFIDALESRKYNKGSDLQSIWLTDDTEDSESEKIHTWLVKDQEKSYVTKENIETIMGVIGKEKERVKKAEENFGKADKELTEIKESGKGDEKKTRNKKKAAISAKYKAKKHLESLYKELHDAMSERSDKHADFIVLRNVNSNKSNLGAHNEILDVLISVYNL